MSKQRQKGTQWETTIRRALNGNPLNPGPDDDPKWPERWINTLDKYESIWPGLNFLWQAGLFPSVERTGSRDYGAGDHTPVGIVLPEAKNHKSLALASWVDQSVASARRNPGLLPAVFHKRKGRNVMDSYVTMPLWAFGILAKKAS